MDTRVGVVALGGLGLIAYLILTGKTLEEVLAEGAEVPKKVAKTGERGLEVTLTTINETLGTVKPPEPAIAVPDRFGGGDVTYAAPAQTVGPFDYLKAKYPLVPEWTAEGAPVVEFYSGQDPREKAQIKAAYKEYERLKRAREEGYDNIGEWMAAREAREEAMRAEARAGIAAAETAKRAQMTQRERIEMKQELGEPLTLQERLATLPGGMTPEEALKGGQMSVGGGQVVQSPAAALAGFIKTVFKIT